MRRSGYYAGPGPTGAFTDTTAAYEAYIRAVGGDSIAFVELYTIKMATLGTVTTSTGAVAGLTFRIAAVDYDVPFEGVAYAGGGWMDGWRIKRKGIKCELGTAVPEMDIEIALDGADLLPEADGNTGVTPKFSLGEAIVGHLFDSADVLYRRLILPSHPTYPIRPGVSIANRGDLLAGDTSLGAVTLFRGTISEFDVQRSLATLKIKGYSEKFQQQTPRRIYQAACPWSLYDKMCAVSRTGSFAGLNFQLTGTMLGITGNNDKLVVDCGGSINNAAFILGTIQFTSGVMCGMRRQIEDCFPNPAGPGQIFVTSPTLPRRSGVGDGVVIQVGCDKVGLVRDFNTGAVTDGTCGTKFNNMARFGGFPHIPPPQTAY